MTNQSRMRSPNDRNPETHGALLAGCVLLLAITSNLTTQAQQAGESSWAQLAVEQVYLLPTAVAGVAALVKFAWVDCGLGKRRRRGSVTGKAEDAGGVVGGDGGGDGTPGQLGKPATTPSDGTTAKGDGDAAGALWMTAALVSAATALACLPCDALLSAALGPHAGNAIVVVFFSCDLIYVFLILSHVCTRGASIVDMRRPVALSKGEVDDVDDDGEPRHEHAD